MSCEEVRALLIEYLYQELPEEAGVRVQAHLSACEACQKELSAFQALSSTLDRWEAPPAPSGLTERTLTRLTKAGVTAGRISAFLQPLLPFLFGAIAVVTAFFLVTLGKPQPQRTILTYGVVGALWAALFAGLFFTTFQAKHRQKSPAAMALVAAGLALAITPFLSIPTVVEACLTWLEGVKNGLMVNGFLFAMGSLYTALPILVSSFFLGRRREARVGKAGLLSGLLYLLLIAPVIELQCASLAFQITLIWTMGAVVGSLAGGPGGLWLARWRPSPLSP